MGRRRKEIRPQPPRYYEYVFKNIVTGKVYVGTTKNPKKRWQNHRYCMKAGKHTVEQLNKDYATYGKESFTFQILQEYDDRIKAYTLETFFMKVLRSQNAKYGYNYKDKAGTGIVSLADKWRTPAHTINNDSRWYYLKRYKMLIPAAVPNG